MLDSCELISAFFRILPGMCIRSLTQTVIPFPIDERKVVVEETALFIQWKSKEFGRKWPSAAYETAKAAVAPAVVATAIIIFFLFFLKNPGLFSEYSSTVMIGMFLFLEN